nr:MAG TPA: hypothetical protein [Caudoviricetes sp.]
MQYNIPQTTRNTLTSQINAISLQGTKKETDKIIIISSASYHDK